MKRDWEEGWNIDGKDTKATNEIRVDLWRTWKEKDVYKDKAFKKTDFDHVLGVCGQFLWNAFNVSLIRFTSPAVNGSALENMQTRTHTPPRTTSSFECQNGSFYTFLSIYRSVFENCI